MKDIPLAQLGEKPPPPRSRMGKRRALALALVHLFIVWRIVDWQLRGETLTPLEPSESAQTLRDGLINAGSILFALAIVSTLVFGRFFCGWLCHVVALQDLCAWGLKKIGIRPKPFRSRLMLWAPLGLALYIFLWQPLAPRLFEGQSILPPQGFQPAFVDDDFWGTFPPPAIAIPFLLVCGFATVYFLGAKGFCTYGCPYGGVFAPVDRVSPTRIVVDHDACESCGHCTAVCTSNVRVHQEVADHGMVIDPGCMKCLDCVSACPNDALGLGVRTPPVLKKTPRATRNPRGLSWGEEAVAGLTFLVVLLATFRAYGPDKLPLLFAGGVAICAMPVAVALWRALHANDVRLLRVQIKRSGAWKPGGMVCLVVAGAAGLLTAHTGWVNYNRWQGDVAYRSIDVSTRGVLTGRVAPLGGDRRLEIERGIAHYETAAHFSRGGIGLLHSDRSSARTASMLIAIGEFQAAGEQLDDLLEREGLRDELAVGRAEVHLQLGEGAAAENKLASAVAYNPAAWQSMELLVELKMRERDATGSIRLIDDALDRIDRSWKTREARGRLELLAARIAGSTGDGPGALRRIENAAQADPRSAQIAEMRAAMLLQIAGDAPAALAELERAIELEPGPAPRHLRLAEIRLSTGDQEGAAEAARAWLARVDQSAETRRVAARFLPSSDSSEAD